MVNYIDFLILILFIYLIWQGYRTGLVAGLLNVAATIGSFVISALIYSKIGDLLHSLFNLNENASPVAGFLVSLVVLEFGLNIIFTFIYAKVAPIYKKSKTVAKIDKYFGIIPSTLVGLFLTSLLMLLILTLPVRPWLREPIQESWWGKNIVSKGIGLVPTVEKTLNKIPYKNLVYILTPDNPSSEKSQELNLPENISLSEDQQSEKEMFDLVNKERRDRGISELKVSDALRDVGRAHCTDMFKRSYFSHYTPEGKSPFDRIQAAGIDYVAAGENLAYAPSLAIAHQGLMNSPGHRENILRKEFGTLGVGVIDGRLNGKMFCQEFTN